MNGFAFGRRGIALLLAAALAGGGLALTALSARAADGAPVAENLTLSTYKDTSVSGQLSAVDPEGDLVTYQLTSQPARGSVTLTDGPEGSFCYTPYATKTGKDSFTYVAVDAEGNVSAPATVKVTISKAKTAVSYVDMEGNPAACAAVRLAESGVFTGQRIGDCWYFEPEAAVTRSEFLAMAMTACDCATLDQVEATGFADDGCIAAWARTYAASALQKGYIQGIRTEAGEVNFAPEELITADQATVMLNNILALTDVSGETFPCDVSACAAWAAQSVTNLSACGIVCNTGESTLTRAQAAQLLAGAMDVLDGRENRSGFLSVMLS